LLKQFGPFRDWKANPMAVTALLHQLLAARSFVPLTLDEVAKEVHYFHRAIARAPEKEVPTEWYDPCLKLKRKFKRMEEEQLERVLQQKKEEFEERQRRMIQNLDYPKALMGEETGQYAQMLKSLYRSFVTFYEEGINSRDTMAFIRKTVRILRDRFMDKSHEQLNKHFRSICQRLSRPTCREAKDRMVKGVISAERLCENDEEVYMSDKERAESQRSLEEKLKEKSGGFYEEMRKRSSKDASEACPHCQQNMAYCENMMQIRSSDEPMTRFMRCNGCSKTWTD
jgi:DNA-directed RNA polymerase subunit M/transcription elongation factor TFIIS